MSAKPTFQVTLRKFGVVVHEAPVDGPLPDIIIWSGRYYLPGGLLGVGSAIPYDEATMVLDLVSPQEPA